MGINALLRRDRVQTRGKKVEVHVVSMQKMTLWQRATGQPHDIWLVDDPRG
jgi:hypothetical protein